jgi:putative membrane protein
MIGFGFTIVQFFDRLHDMDAARAALRPGAPRYLGLMLIGAGTLALLISIWQYRMLLGYLWSDAYRPIAPHERRMTPAYAVSIVTICIGIFAFVAVWTRLA